MQDLVDSPRAHRRSAEAVLDEAAKRRRHSIRLREDAAWLHPHSANPARLLDEMAKRNLLYRVAGGRYVTAPMGSTSLEQAAPAELLVDVLLSVRRRPSSGVVKRPPRLPGRELHLAYLSAARWPRVATGELERVRAFADAKELWMRSSLERTLFDVLARPELSGGIETAISAWSRARVEGRADWNEVARISTRLGPSAEEPGAAAHPTSTTPGWGQCRIRG